MPTNRHWNSDGKVRKELHYRQAGVWKSCRLRAKFCLVCRMVHSSHTMHYATTRRFAVVSGNPHCCQSLYAASVAAFEQEQLAGGRRTCFFGTGEDFALACGQHYCHALIGAEPLWNLASWCERQAANKPIRNSLSAAHRAGCTVREASLTDAHIETACSVVRRKWLQTKHLPPLHFVAETEIMHEGTRCFVVESGGTVVGYGIARRSTDDVKTSVGREYGIEHFIRAPDAPPGTVELLIDHIAQTLAVEGEQRLSLRLAPFSRKASCLLPPDLRSQQMESYLQAIARFGGYWYNAAGLERFKAKFLPDEWKPLYCSFRWEDSPLSVLAALTEVFLAEPMLPSAMTILRQTVRQAFSELALY